MGCVFVYKFKEDKWSCLPPLQKHCGVPMNINKKLVIVGGCEKTSSLKAMYCLTTFYNNSQNNDTFPNKIMLTARIWPDVASHHQSYIIVVGGKSDGNTLLNSIRGTGSHYFTVENNKHPPTSVNVCSIYNHLWQLAGNSWI